MLKELEILFQRLQSIVYTTLSVQSQFSFLNIVWGRIFRTVLLVFEPFLDMMLMPTAYSDNSIGLNTQFQIQKASMVYKSLNDLVPGYLSSKVVKG